MALEVFKSQVDTALAIWLTLLQVEIGLETFWNHFQPESPHDSLNKHRPWIVLANELCTLILQAELYWDKHLRICSSIFYSGVRLTLMIYNAHLIISYIYIRIRYIIVSMWNCCSPITKLSLLKRPLLSFPDLLIHEAEVIGSGADVSCSRDGDWGGQGFFLYWGHSR